MESAAAPDHPAPPWPCPGRHLVLIGPTGAGKSTVGRQLARLLRAPFVDLDEQIEAQSGAPIPLIFEHEGEAGFRQRESEALAQALTADPPSVLATGGGAVLAVANRLQMARRGYLVYLRTPVAVQIARLARDGRRPLLQAPDREQRLRQMAATRNPIYEALADISLDSIGDNPKRTARRLAALHGWLPNAEQDLEQHHAPS